MVFKMRHNGISLMVILTIAIATSPAQATEFKKISLPEVKTDNSHNLKSLGKGNLPELRQTVDIITTASNYKSKNTELTYIYKYHKSPKNKGVYTHTYSNFYSYTSLTSQNTPVKKEIPEPSVIAGAIATVSIMLTRSKIKQVSHSDELKNNSFPSRESL
ncbi:hypothetical protein [Calothrix sp. 336/3]|uniref:hypothetical protein n=1 Tax=Calothrix sp. 336/3 TaxID=1337936 RepID=UPI0004E3078D|nr:hypothetical protein [Calothrix sp. 336/3]AKG22828.1 hypothetical protein IJ00_17490 [Calothrix sp. 336/3]